MSGYINQKSYDPAAVEAEQRRQSKSKNLKEVVEEKMEESEKTTMRDKPLTLAE